MLKTCGATAVTSCLIFIAMGFQPAQGGDNLNRVLRLFGVGWSDGYHSCVNGGCRPGADLPPKSYPHMTQRPAIFGAVPGPMIVSQVDNSFGVGPSCSSCASAPSYEQATMMSAPMMVPASPNSGPTPTQPVAPSVPSSPAGGGSWEELPAPEASPQSPSDLSRYYPQQVPARVTGNRLYRAPQPQQPSSPKTVRQAQYAPAPATYASAPSQPSTAPYSAAPRHYGPAATPTPAPAPTGIKKLFQAAFRKPTAAQPQGWAPPAQPAPQQQIVWGNQ